MSCTVQYATFTPSALRTLVRYVIHNNKCIGFNFSFVCECVNVRASIRVVKSEASARLRTRISKLQEIQLHVGSTRYLWKSYIILYK